MNFDKLNPKIVSVKPITERTSKSQSSEFLRPYKKDSKISIIIKVLNIKPEQTLEAKLSLLSNANIF